MRLIAPVRLLGLVVGLAAWSGLAFADCSTPSAPAGSLNYSTGNDRFEYCDSADSWQPLGSGVSAVGSLTDISLTNLAGRDYLRYDAGSGVWVNISESAVMSTTTMVDGWPDAILCGFDAAPSTPLILYLSHTDNAGNVSYFFVPNTGYSARFDNITGAYSTGSGMTTSGPYACQNKNLNDLYATGQAFNFIGGIEGNGSSAEGDRITSGTLAVIANSATSYISLSTGSTNWGYLSSGNSYLPRLAAGQVSATNVSGSAAHIGQLCDITGANCSDVSAGLGVSYLASLTEVSITNLAGRDYLRYDAGSGVWVNISESAVMSTTTMVPGWPDAIKCTGNGFSFNPVFLMLAQGPTSSAVARYFRVGTTSDDLRFDSSTGEYSAINGWNSSDCEGKSISELYADGQAFNFIGGIDGSGGSALGERITSGTLAVIANSNTNYVSLSTNGVVWGYFGEATSYLPRMDAGTISSINLSGTLVQVGTGNGASCDTARRGALRYSTTSSTVEYCQGTAWVSMGPSATDVPAFYVHKNGTNQTVATSTDVKLTWNTEVFDTNNNFASDRFTPTVAGKYLFVASVYCANAGGGVCYAEIYKNGTKVSQNGNVSGASNLVANTSIILDMNGSTDYVEAFVYSAGNTVSGLTYFTYFNGTLIASGNGLAGGGGASAINDLSDVNTSGAAAGNVLRYDGSNWVVSESSAGESAIASLTDVSLTNLAGRDYLRYDAGSGLWVNISESTVMSTTTMMPGWPDALKCAYSGDATDPLPLVLGQNNASGVPGRHYYASHLGQASWNITFNADGSYLSSTGLASSGSYNCVNKSISQLYAAGLAFNFIGSSGGDSGGSALGDRITSGTLTVTANSATSVVSLSTGSTNWGYLSSGNSYLPTISAGKVSATNVSGTYLHLSSATTVLACGSGLEGAMRYTSGTMQVCDGSNWGNIGIGVPTGTIAAFEASSCPAGWSEYTPARGRFLRGIDTLAGGIDPDGTRSAGGTQGDAAPNIAGVIGSIVANSNAAATGPFSKVHASGVGSAGSLNTFTQFGFDASNANAKYGAADEIRPKNVAVTFCQYNGYASALSTGVATLASLSDVSVGGATTGQALIFDGASWIASDTAAGGSTGPTDRISSSTSSAVVRTFDGGTISLTTGGVAGTSYFDTAGRWIGPGISVTMSHGISSSNGYFAGNVGIGTSSAAAKLDVAGNVSVTGGVSVTGSVKAYAFVHPSDERLKQDIRTIANASEILAQLRGTHFTWRQDGVGAYGVIAQEVEKVLPELVPDGEGLKTVDYDQLVPILIEGWKVHQKTIAELRAANDNLRRELEAADDNDKKAIEGLEQRLRKLEAGGAAR